MLLVSVFLSLILFIQMLAVMLFRVNLLRVRRNKYIYVTTIKHEGIDENESSKACAIIVELLL